MRNIARYLVDNYYTKNKIEADEKALHLMLDLNKDKVIVVADGMDIKGVAVFLTLTDQSFKEVEEGRVFSPEMLLELLKEDGDNIHIILLATKGIKPIMAGIRAIKRERDAKSISWWNPSMNRFHKYNLN